MRTPIVRGSDPAELTLTELLSLLASRLLSGRELLEACLARVEADERQVQAFVLLTPQWATAAAEQADAARVAGRPHGVLAGIPLALKDLYLTAGLPTTASSKVLAGHDPGLDAAVWERLRAAGAGLLGKTTLHEFAYGTGSYPTRNPWDLTRTTGGSSGGSGAALAARMVPVAMGSDTGGSLRIPASACGLSTLRPAHGRISTYGVLPLAATLDTAGPMARRMLDVSLLLRLLAGPDPRDPRSLDGPVPDYPSVDPGRLDGVRIGVPTAGFWEEADDEVEQLCREGLDLLVARGANLVAVTPPAGLAGVAAMPGVYGDLMNVEALAHHREWLGEREQLYGAQVLGRLRAAARTTPEQHVQAEHDRARWTQDWRVLFAELRLDAVAHPTLLQPPSTVPGPDPSIWPSKAWSVAGFPSLSVPVGLDSRGLPVGLSLSSLPEQEAALVGLGIAVDEDVRLWQHRSDLSGQPKIR